MLRMIIGSAVAFWAAAASAQAIPGIEPGREPFEVVRDGLAAEMALSAAKLEAGERHEATKALDRALHLAEFATAAHALPAGKVGPFHDAHQAIKEARHQLQTGDPEQAAERLSAGSEKLAGADLAPVADVGLNAEHASDLEGLSVLNARGHWLGEIDGYEEGGADGRLALVGRDAFLWWGETIIPVPTEHLLGAKSYVVLPSTISPEEFSRATELQ